MVTSNMTLSTTTDADFWAGDILEGTEYGDNEKRLLSDWIWNNKPDLDCTYENHPISTMDFNDLIEIIEQ